MKQLNFEVLTREYLIRYNLDSSNIEFEQWLSTLNEENATLLLEFMANQI